jgi:hypothetical protein
MTAIEITPQVTNVAFEITQSDGVVIEVAPVANTVVIEVAMAVGESSSPASPQNVFIQQSQPTISGAFAWFELNNDNTLKTIWINTP